MVLGRGKGGVGYFGGGRGWVSTITALREEVIVVVSVVVAMVVIEQVMAVVKDCGQNVLTVKLLHELVGDSVAAERVGPQEMKGYHQEYPQGHPHRWLVLVGIEADLTHDDALSSSCGAYLRCPMGTSGR
ncbi:hypothetical protein GOBAR_AA02090 [Gossypium barbadense]|uniref:Uncharacterized protein n=1 Tax=Gossypium barbadense TaxID=3634 RepID=A0A2P5YS93_GOSBA|nr:hypothetical protein GOBAR_AA02090 [Gossypium barbadense]